MEAQHNSHLIMGYCLASTALRQYFVTDAKPIWRLTDLARCGALMVVNSHQMADNCLQSKEVKRSPRYTSLALLKENVLRL